MFTVLFWKRRRRPQKSAVTIPCPFWIASNAGRFNLSIMHMKPFFVFALVAMGILRASAQVSVELAMDQEQFLPSEAVPLAVKITNRSGQPLHLGAEANWLTFSVEADDGFVVIKNAEVPVVEVTFEEKLGQTISSLSEILKIDAETAKKLVSGGFLSVEGLRAVDAADISKIPDLSEEEAKKVVKALKNMDSKKSE